MVKYSKCHCIDFFVVVMIVINTPFDDGGRSLVTYFECHCREFLTV